jgi:hypothetical protein
MAQDERLVSKLISKAVTFTSRVSAVKLNKGFASCRRAQVIVTVVFSSARKWRQLRECEHVWRIPVVNVQVRDIDLIVPAPLDPGFGLSAGYDSIVFVGESQQQANNSRQNVPLNLTISLLNHDPCHNIVVEGKCCLEPLLVCSKVEGCSVMVFT